MTPRTTRPAPPRSARSRPASRQAPLADFARSCGLTGPFRVVVNDEDGNPAGEHLLRGPFAFLGRGRRADVPLDSPDVSPRHAFVQAVGGRVFVLDLGSRTGVRWADGPRACGWVGPGEEVRIGPFTLRFHLDSATEPGPVGGPELSAIELLNHTGPAPVRPLADPVTLVGRASVCPFRGYGPKLAAHHCALVRSGGLLWVIDLRSGAGTNVNGRPVRFARLRDGDLIEAGEWSAAPRPEAAQCEALVPAHPEPGPVVPPSVFAPFGQMMDQFQQCVLMMGQMFRAMQQEHLTLVRDQVVQLRDVARALLDRQAEGVAVPYAEAIPDALPALADVPPPSPNFASADEAEMLLEAHAWFNQRLAHLSAGQS
jgi:pSer/pThr/pTyr-binding forkhead associated (FHA) protein